jgi:hypothetical protein
MQGFVVAKSLRAHSATCSFATTCKKEAYKI